MAQHNVAKAKAIHQKRQAQRDANVAELTKAAQPLRGFMPSAPRPNAKPRKAR